MFLNEKSTDRSDTNVSVYTAALFQQLSWLIQSLRFNLLYDTSSLNEEESEVVKGKLKQHHLRKFCVRKLNPNLAYILPFLTIVRNIINKLFVEKYTFLEQLKPVSWVLDVHGFKPFGNKSSKIKREIGWFPVFTMLKPHSVINTK